MTPYARHQTQNHATTISSPDGINTVEECTDCGLRFLHRAINPTAPILLRYIPNPK